MSRLFEPSIFERNDTGGSGAGGTGKVGMGPKKTQITLPEGKSFEFTVQLDPATGVLNLTYRSDPDGGGSGGGTKAGLGRESKKSKKSKKK